MAMSLGRGYSTSSVAQTIGRVTGNSRDILEENGFDCVRVLSTYADLTLTVKMGNYMKEIGVRVNQGETFEQAVSFMLRTI